MRVFVVLVALLSLGSSSAASPRSKRPSKHARARQPVEATATAARTPVRDRSVGAPWSGRLRGPARLEAGDGYLLRRPHRTFATRTTVELVRQAIRDTFEVHRKAHTLAVGDLSAKDGGRITEHNSHQSGRDVDLGLFYKHSPPRGYPEAFVKATARTLDPAPVWTMLASFARTANEDGGAQMIFLDQGLQEVLRAWATKRGLSHKRIERVFRLLRHEPHHDDHIHVRFKCRARDKNCR